MSWIRVLVVDGDGGKDINVGMVLKIEKTGLAERLDNDGEERTKSKVMLRYFGLSISGETAPLTEVGRLEEEQVWSGDKFKSSLSAMLNLQCLLDI